MKHMIKLLFVLLSVAALLSTAALGEGAPQIVTETIPDAVCLVDTAIDSDEAMEGYFMGLLGLDGDGRLFQPRNVGGDLTGLNKTLYNFLKSKIAQVADGALSSTVFEVPLSTLGASGQFSAKDLGVSSIVNADNTINADAKNAMMSKVQFDISLLTRALLWDHPYELYWFDKTVSVKAAYPEIKASFTSSHTNDRIYFSGVMTFRFPVAKDYASGEYAFNTSLAATAKKAANSAKNTVARYADDTDYGKLLGYKETICSLATYNKAASEGSGNYGNPWQLIWVFDGDPDTSVVCEGYAKSFQYLCDMTTFDDNRVTCYCVTGTLSSSSQDEGHMWNIVRMPNGLNYHVDITNCDTGTKGAPDRLFMVGCPDGSPNSNYIFSDAGYLKYTYKPDTLKLFTTAELTLSPNSYLDDTSMPVNAVYFPDAALRACVAAQCDTNGDGYLTAQEVKAAQTLNISGKGVASLKGVEFLTSLTSLNCANNSLTALDMTLIPEVTELHCEGNGFASLDLTNNPLLASVVNVNNRSWSGGVKTYAASRRVLSCDIDVELRVGRQISATLTLPANLRTIGANAFEGTPANRVILPAGCGSIGARAFADCPNLWEIDIPASVTTISENAFAGSEEVTIISSSESIRLWARNHGIASRAK